MKFGGSSVASAERITGIAEIIMSQRKRKPVIVLSAMGDTTDYLLEAAETALKKSFVSIEKIEELHVKAADELKLGAAVKKEIKNIFWELGSLLTGISLTKELTGRTRDCLVSFGERLSVRIAAAYFRTLKLKAQAFDAWEIGFVSDSAFGRAELRGESFVRIASSLLTITAGGVMPVITGFIAKDEDGNITTLGRGGSDLSATVIAAACRAEEVQVWKDVDGILTADPRLVKDARPVEKISFEEAAELAYFGAQVLHPRAMQPCMKSGIPALVKNSYNPKAPGTRIEAKTGKNAVLVRAITSKKNVTLVDIVSTSMLGQPGFLAQVFSAFAASGVSVDMVATSEVSVSVTLDAERDPAVIKRDLSRVAAVDVKTGKAIVTVIGDVSRSSEILSRAFGVCEKRGVQVQMISQGASKVNVSFIIDDSEASGLVLALHRDFFPLEGEKKSHQEKSRREKAAVEAAGPKKAARKRP
jgi:aspartate kinase